MCRVDALPTVSHIGSMNHCNGRRTVSTAGFASVNRWLKALCRDERGVTAIEYGLLAALIAVFCIGAFQATGGSLSAMYVKWTNAVMAAL